MPSMVRYYIACQINKSLAEMCNSELLIKLNEIVYYQQNVNSFLHVKGYQLAT